MQIRPATVADRPAIWSVIGPTIRAGETYTLDRGMPETDALDYWLGPTARRLLRRKAGRFSAPITSAGIRQAAGVMFAIAVT